MRYEAEALVTSKAEATIYRWWVSLRHPYIFLNRVYYLFADYNAFRGGLKSALHRTFLTTKGTKGAQRAQSLNLHVPGSV